MSRYEISYSPAWINLLLFVTGSVLVIHEWGWAGVVCLFVYSREDN